MPCTYSCQLPLSSSHRALRCYDVLCSIFEELAPLEEVWYDYEVAFGNGNAWYNRQADFVRKNTLARCARVCKAFYTPAIGVLWRDLDDLSPLLSVIRAEHARQESAPTLRSRASELAGHVRAIHGLGKPVSSSEHELLPNVHALSTSYQPLLPQLRHLRWVQFVPSGYELLQLIPPSLHGLHIIFRQSASWSEHVAKRLSPSPYELFVRDLLGKVVSRAPHLRYLRISTTGDVQESWLEPVGGFSGLETVDAYERIYCEVTTSPLVLSLASLQHLCHLKLRLPTELSSCIVSDAFPVLETLTLDAMFAPLGVVSTFLAAITSRTLRSLLLQNCECNTFTVAATLHDVCAIIRSHFTTSLRELELSLRGVGPEAPTNHQPLVHAIEPLLDMHDLEDVRLSIAPEVAVVPASDDDLGKLAEAWPKATRLHLCYFPSTVTPSLADVAEFARHCVGLTDLVLPAINASTSCGDVHVFPIAKPGQAPTVARRLAPASAPQLSDTVSEGERTVHVHRLKSLRLSDSGWNSRIPDPERLAKFLDELFPEAEWKCPPLASEDWRDTIDEVVRLRVMRMF